MRDAMKLADINLNWKLYSLILLGSLSAGLTSIKPSLAQSNILPDNTLGAEKSQIVPNVNNKNGIPTTLIEGGAQRGENLFHSFEEFNVSEGQGAYFLVPNDGIENVLTRVTGNNPSTINGILGTISNRNFDPTSANLFLINPNGIIFGKNSSLDLGGSFVVTTANAIEFGDQGFFSATFPQRPSELLTISPTAFLFNQINARASIENNSITELGLDPIAIDLGANPNPIVTVKGLRVPDGKSLLLLGGNISMDGGQLNANDGRIELGGLAEVGTVALERNGDQFRLRFPKDITRASVSLANGAVVLVQANVGGDIAINARNIEIAGSRLVGSGVGDGANITINASDTVFVTGSLDNGVPSVIVTGVISDSTGNGGDITIKAGSIILENRTLVAASIVKGQGRDGKPAQAGNVDFEASEQIIVNGSSILSEVRPESFGNGGKIQIKAPEVILKNRLIRPDLGDIFGSLVTQMKEGARGERAGDIEIEAGRLLITNSSIDALSEGSGNGGSIKIKASEIILQNNSELLTQVGEKGEGNAGNIEIEADKLLITNSNINARSAGIREAGKININLKNDFNADNGQVLAQAQQSSGGEINITAKNIILRNNSDIKTILSTTAGSGGDIQLNSNTIVALEDSDILAFAPEGSGGDITFNTRVFLSDPLYRPTLQKKDVATLNTLDGNNRSDVNATGSTPGTTGTISGADPDNFLQDSLIELAENLIDKKALIASSCVVRSKERNGTFFITGAGSFPYRPGDTVPSVYSAVAVQSVTDDISHQKPGDRWKIGDPIVEPTGVYRLTNGRRILSQECRN